MHDDRTCPISDVRWATFLRAHPELTPPGHPRHPWARAAAGCMIAGVGIAGAVPAAGIILAATSAAALGATLCLDRGCCRRWLP